jgi:hypothetical protein
MIIRQKEFGKKTARLTNRDKNFIKSLAEEKDHNKVYNKQSYRALQGFGALTGGVGAAALIKKLSKSKKAGLIGGGIASIGTGIALNKPIKAAIDRANYKEDVKYVKRRGGFIFRDRIDRDRLIDKREKELNHQI